MVELDFFLRLPWIQDTRKPVECIFCYKIIRKREKRYRFDSGFSKTRMAYWYNLHQACYGVVLRLTIKRLQKTIKEL